MDWIKFIICINTFYLFIERFYGVVGFGNSCWCLETRTIVCAVSILTMPLYEKLIRWKKKKVVNSLQVAYWAHFIFIRSNLYLNWSKLSETCKSSISSFIMSANSYRVLNLYFKFFSIELNYTILDSSNTAQFFECKKCCLFLAYLNTGPPKKLFKLIWVRFKFEIIGRISLRPIQSTKSQLVELERSTYDVKTS